jgi:hypothetical protein
VFGIWAERIRSLQDAIQVAAEIVDNDDRAVALADAAQFGSHALTQEKGGRRFASPSDHIA